MNADDRPGSIPSGIARRRGSRDLMSASDHNGRRLTQRNETKTSLPIKLAPGMAAAKTCVAFSHAGVGQYGASSRPVAYMPRPKTEWPITLFSRVTFGLGVRDPAMPIPIPGIIIK